MSKKRFTEKKNFQRAKGLTSEDLILRRLKEGLDPLFRNSVFLKQRYAWGEPWRKGMQPGVQNDMYVDYVQSPSRLQEVGRSRRIANALFISLSRTMYNDPKPEFLALGDTYRAEVQKQFFLERFHEGEWADQLTSVFLDGEGVGIGFAQIGLKTNPLTGQQKVTLTHSPTLHTLWDRTHRQPSEADWVCFVHYDPVEVAAERFGDRAAEANTRELYDGIDMMPRPVVRWFEYYDKGTYQSKPTRAVMLGAFLSKPLLVEENDFGILPMAYYLHFMGGGQPRPTGMIDTLMPTQEEINKVEKRIRRTVDQGSARVVRVDELDRDDLKRYNAGEQSVLIKWTRPNAAMGGEPPIQQIAGGEVSETTLKYFSMLDSQFTSDSGVTDFDRGVQPQQDRTLGEDMLIDQRGSTQGSWTQLQCARLFERVVDRVLDVSALFDRDPLRLHVFGKLYTVNRAGAPASSMKAWLSERCRAVINVDGLRYQDVQQERVQRLQQLLQVAPFVGKALDLKKYAEELALALGAQDPNEWIDPSLLHAAVGSAAGTPQGLSPGGPVSAPPGSAAPPMANPGPPVPPGAMPPTS